MHFEIGRLAISFDINELFFGMTIQVGYDTEDEFPYICIQFGWLALIVTIF